jgi:hypothetical protein
MKRSDQKLNEPRVDLHKMRILDIILIVMILLGSAGGLLGSTINWKESPPQAKAIIVYHDGTLTENITLDRDRKILLLAGKMVLEVHNNSVRVARSDCPRQFCVHQGWASVEGESIICVPYKTLIEVKSTARPMVDAVVY